jgi:hypothetical protein
MSRLPDLEPMGMFRSTFIAGFLIAVMIGQLPAPARADVPAWLPRYDVDMQVDVAGHMAHVRQRVTWTNRHQRPATELVFNAHSHYRIPGSSLLLAKTIELLRVAPSTTMEDAHAPPALQVSRIRLGDQSLRSHYQEGNGKCLSVTPPTIEDGEGSPAGDGTALVVFLPQAVKQGESVTIELEFDFRLPQKQGRWGQWMGVTFLSNWLPVLAVYDETGWQPTPYIPWHQPFFNEAGIYTGRASFPCDQHIACTCSVQSARDLPDGRRQVEFVPRCARDFAFLCSARYQEYQGQVGGVRIHCLAFPEHEHYARSMIQSVCEAIPTYEQWIGPFPYPDFTIAESYFGWNGNECGGLVMIDERVFDMPHVADGFPELLVSHELCHQWWYNIIGTNGYGETWMDESMATHFSHRLVDKKHGKNSPLIHYPGWLGWLPNIHRNTYRSYGLSGTIARGEATETLHDMQDFGSVVTLFSMAYDRGGKIVDMIADRLGEAAFHDFTHRIYERYQYRILRVADYQRELGEYTGQREYWDQFFDRWLRGSGMCDWAVEKVSIRPMTDSAKFMDALHAGKKDKGYRVSVLLCQKAEYTEPTTVGFSFDGTENYQLRIPVEPALGSIDFQDPPAHVEAISGNRVRVDVVLQQKPTQISVDPDQIIVDPNPVNNHWKPVVRWRFTPFNNPIEETEIVNDYDRLNVIFGPGFSGSAYADPWYAKSPVIGLRAAAFRIEDFLLAGYTGFRTDFGDLVVGAEGLIDHWPYSHTQVGFNVERSLTNIDGADRNDVSQRAAVFGRYVFLYNSSLYLPPIHYVEVFGAVRENVLPLPKQEFADADHFDHQTVAGVHYHLDLRTPYWDPEQGFCVDATVATGIPICGEQRSFNSFETQYSQVFRLPDCLGPLSQTRLAYRAYAAGGLPNDGEYFALGGSQLFRGYDPRERQGSLIWIGSVEWRVPLVQDVEWDYFDHVAGIRNLYAAAFYDVGDAYVTGHSMGPVAHAVGMGLRLDVAWLSFVERSTLRFDVAKTINGNAPLQFWFGVQAPF